MATVPTNPITAYSRAGSIVFWRTVDGHVSSTDRLSLPVTVAAGGLVSMAIVIVLLAGPISAYVDATAAQLFNTSEYLNVLNLPVIAEGL